MRTHLKNLVLTRQTLLANLFIVLCFCCLSGCGKSDYDRANEAVTKKDWYGAKKLLEGVRRDESDFAKAQELLRTVRHEFASENFIKAKGTNPTVSNWALLDSLLKDFPKEHPNFNDSRVILDQYYFPMARGNKWDYESHLAKGIEGTETETMFNQLLCGTNLSRSDEITDSLQDGFLFVSTNNIGNLFTVKTKCVNQLRNGMIMEAAAGGGVLDKPLQEHVRKPIILKLPIAVGAAWEYKNEKEYTISLEITKLYDSLEVENSVYRNVVEVKKEDPEPIRKNSNATMVHYFFYAYKIGLIAEASELHDQFDKYRKTIEKRFTFLLKGYSVR
jgi:hypothetical protein